MKRRKGERKKLVPQEESLYVNDKRVPLPGDA